jgi:hypothetical protein
MKSRIYLLVAAAALAATSIFTVCKASGAGGGSAPESPIITRTAVYDYADESNSGWDELASFITAHQGDGNSAATPANIRIINADDMDVVAMAAVNTKVTTAGAYVTLDLSDTSNSFDSNTVTKAMMSDNIKDNTRIKGIALPEGLSSIGN